MNLDKNKIKAVFFDFDDTLGDRDRYAYDCARSILLENVQPVDPVEFEAIVQDWMLWDEKGNIDKNHIKDMLAKKYGIMLPYEDLNPVWDDRLWKFCVPFPDAEETLEYLCGKYKLGIITNGPSEGQRNKIAHAGLAHFFFLFYIFVSGDFQFKKPDKRLFLIACEKMGVKPEESIFVGDIFSNDVLGAYRAGMIPVWIWTPGARKVTADILVIHRISELMKLL